HFHFFIAIISGEGSIWDGQLLPTHHSTVTKTTMFSSLGRCLFALLVGMTYLRRGECGYAPDKSPELPDGFCPKETGTVTATTGECMCNWQHKDGCECGSLILGFFFRLVNEKLGNTLLINIYT
ncbi:hypothetical protein ACHAW6_006776, partial [Cyclotella cf. meneghiniana]